MSDIQTILKEIQDRNLNIQQIARESKVKADKIYKWLDGRGSPKVEDGEKLKVWATNNLGKIPKTYAVNETVSQVKESESELIVSLLKRQNLIMERQNNILEKLSHNVESKVQIIEVNLSDALSRIDSIKLDVYSGRQVMLQSLARLEKKKVNSLVQEADNISLSYLEPQKTKQGSSPGMGK